MQLKFKVRAGVEAMVGWDVPMQTFFGQVFTVDEDGERAEDEPILWVGGKPEEIRSVDDLQRRMLPYAQLPPKIHRQLYEIEID